MRTASTRVRIELFEINHRSALRGLTAMKRKFGVRHSLRAQHGNNIANEP